MTRATIVFSALVAVLAGPHAARAQTDNFNDGDDAGWSRLDLNTGTGGQLPGASYTFPDDGEGGKAYRLRAPAPPIVDAGPARAFSYRATDYTRFGIGVDLINWDTGVDQAFGILARASSIGLGSTDAYVMNYNQLDGDLQINRADGEIPTTIAETPVLLTPMAGRYRFVFEGYNDNLLGRVFALPDLVNPAASVIAVDGAHAMGKAGVFIFDRNDPAQYTFAEATFDNYDASVPPTGSLRAAVVELAPRPHEQSSTETPTVKAAILDRETTVDAGSIQLWVDGVEIPRANLMVTAEVLAPNNPTPFAGATVSYSITNALAAGSVHTNRVVFKESTGVFQTNEWVFSSIPLLRASHAAPPGSGRDAGFAVRLVQAPGGSNLANSLARAEAQLATPSSIPASLTTNTTARVINYTQKAVPSDPFDGYFPDEATFPGIDPSGNTDDIAMEVLFYLELAAGRHTFGVRSDDGFKLASGASPTDPLATVLGQQFSGTFDGTFNFAAEQPGLYPFRFVWFERGGGAHVELFSVNPSTDQRTLINDPNTASAIKAYMSVSGPLPGVTILNPHFAANNFVVSFQSEAGRIYTLESSADLISWGDSSIAPAAGNGAVLEVSIPAQTAARAFYRVRTQ